MRHLIAIVAAALMLAGCASTQIQLVDTISLSRGQSVTLHFDEGGGAVLVERGPAPAFTPFEQRVVRDLSGGVYDHAVGGVSAPMTVGDGPAPAPVTPYAVRIKFVATPGGEHTMLMIENGYDGAFTYRAIMTRRGESETTDVCQVQPMLRGFEHWPYRIDNIELRAMHLAPWREGDRVVCE
jgi:hypothetical protein